MNATTIEPQAPVTPRKLEPAHISHLLSEGFSPETIDDWLERGIVFSATEEEVRAMGIGVKDRATGEFKTSSGIVFKYSDNYEQVRLDCLFEYTNDKGKRVTVGKYLTPGGKKSIPFHPPGAKVVTEGFKDAMAGTLWGGIPTAAMAGISHYKKAFPEEGGGLITIGDSDGWHNPGVFEFVFNSGLHQGARCIIIPMAPEQKAGLVEFLKDAENPQQTYQKLLDGASKPKQLLLEWAQHWKNAPPDRIVAMSRKAVRLAAKHLSRDEQIAIVNSIASASGYSRKQVEQMLAEELDRIQAESSDGGDQPKKDKPPIASLMAREIAEEYRDRLAYDDKSGRWLEYSLDNRGMWSAVSKEYVQSAIAAILEGKGYSFGSGYLNDVLVLTRNKLLIRKWDERSAKEFLPFENGVLEIATGQLLPHAPGYRFTWQLPRQHNVLAQDWSNISQFLDEATGGNKALRNILICYGNALLKGRSDLQKFLFLIGRGGTGKGTLMRLLSALVGEANIHSSTLADFCGNQFESANAYQKRGVFFWDEDRKVGRLGKLKALTGGDWIRGEEKGMKAFQFRFDGMVAIAANFPIFAGDSSSGLSRRIITVPMNQRPAKRKNLEKFFEGELDAFTNYLLSLDDDFVTRTLLGEECIPAVDYEFWENRQRTDSIAAWLNDWVILDPEKETQVGNRKDEATSQYEATTLYGSYCLYCHQNGFSTKSSKNFSPDLLELCTSILGWQASKTHTKTGKYVRGLRLRSHQDFDIPTYDFVLLQRTQVTGDGWGDGSVTGRVTGRVTGQDVQPESVTENSPLWVTDKSELGEEGHEKKFASNFSETKKNIFSPDNNPNSTGHLSPKIAETTSQQESQPVTQPVTQSVTNPSPHPSPPTEEDLEGIVVMLGDDDFDRDGVNDVTAHLSPEQKRWVWGQLPDRVRDRLKALFQTEDKSDSDEVAKPEPESGPSKLGPDYSEFPWERDSGWMPGEDRDRTKRKKAEQLRDELLAITSGEDDDKIFMKWGSANIRWVDANLLTPEEVASRRNLLAAIANSEQQSLL